MIVFACVSTLLFGCTQYKDGKPVDPPKVEAEEKDNLNEALKSFKQGEVVEVTDSRDNTDNITVEMKFSESVGAKTQAGGTISNAKSFLKKINEKPKTLTVHASYKGAKVLQFTIQDNEIKLEQAHKDIEKYLKDQKYVK